MKFISTATTAALAGILLLAPAAYGNRQFKCDDGNLMSLEDVKKKACNSAFVENIDKHPNVPTEESHKSYLFAQRTYANIPGLSAYLLQVYGDPKKYQLSQYSDMEWKVCSLQDIR
ncbi:unnamed protein product [Blumeria hordei]|uniref:Uncharacterized protein n=1 Tax=Blumeria hordei TaxID=2867405 RepID=A0A383USP7_BLUHO|nr:unnamed protein product [Blumeria hordei]